METLEKPKETEFLAISDTPLAASISALGFEIEDIDRTDTTGRVSFVFRKTPEIEKIIKDYQEKILMIEPQHYFHQLKLMKLKVFGSRWLR